MKGVVPIQGLDSLYFVIEKEGKPQNIPVMSLTPDELNTILEDKDELWCKGIIKYLVYSIQRMRTIVETKENQSNAEV